MRILARPGREVDVLNYNFGKTAVNLLQSVKLVFCFWHFYGAVKLF